MHCARPTPSSQGPTGSLPQASGSACLCFLDLDRLLGRLADLQHPYGRGDHRLSPDAGFNVFKLNAKTPKVEWATAKWLFPYLIGLGVISYFGGFGQGGIIGGVSPLKTFLSEVMAICRCTGTSLS